jgi:hypothetical protein
LELLRGLLTYYHYATTESRHEALQSEINRINAAANEQRDRYRSQFAVEKQAPQRYDGLPPEYDDPPPPYDDEPPYDDDDAQTRVINGRHRRGFGGG